MSQADYKLIKECLQLLLRQNESYARDMAELKKENADLIKQESDRKARIEANKRNYESLVAEKEELEKKLPALKEELIREEVEEGFFSSQVEPEQVHEKVTELEVPADGS